jgi:hypothetical protein
MSNPIFYSSNTDKHFTPEEAGWYIQYHTESGDSGAIKVDREPKDKADALEMLEEINADELWYVDYFAEVYTDVLKYSDKDVVDFLLNCKNLFGGSELHDYVSDEEVIEWFNTTLKK